MQGAIKLKIERRGRRRKVPVTLAGERSHDRTAAQLPMNAAVSVSTVDDPYSTVGGKIDVTVSLRDDPLARMKARGQIDAAQYHAGRHWQKDYEASEVGSVKGMDPTKEPVDGGGAFPEIMTDCRLRAIKAISAADAELGIEGGSLVRALLGRRLTIEQVALERGYESEREIRYFGRRFRETLETLAFFYGYAQKRGGLQSSIRGWDDSRGATRAWIGR